MTEEQHIQKGFNAGYQIEKHDSELSKTILNGFTDKEHPYAKGFMAGSQEYTLEVAKEKRVDNSLLSKYMNNSDQQEQGGKEVEKDSDLER